MQCGNCGFTNPEGERFCEECGTTLIHACPRCGVEVRPTAKFCGDCGSPLSFQPLTIQPQAETAPQSAQQPARKGQRRRVKRPKGPQQPPPRSVPEAERRHLTVLFCDLVGSTMLSEQLDPEELREVVRAYQATCATVIRRFEGYIAQYLGDGLLVYFGYPTAHEDDAARAVRTGLGIIEELYNLPTRFRRPLRVRLGIHTGLVVVGEIGEGERTERLALGDTPNIAARVQSKAEPDTIVISAATYRLVHGLFECVDLGDHEVRGLSAPLPLYRVVQESGAQTRFEAAVSHGLTPLVGREPEVGLLLERWERAKHGEGQIVLLGGEPGIGKSRLVHELKEQVIHEGYTRIEFRCSPYYQNTAFYPVIDHLQQVLQFQREDSPQARLEKLERALSRYSFSHADTTPLLASLLSLPPPTDCSPLNLSPQRQKQKTQEVLGRWLLEEAERQPVLAVWEDLHWADPSTLELLSLLIKQVPTARLSLLLTCRPEFMSPWGTHSHLSQLTLSRLERRQVEQLVERVTGGKVLPTAVLQQIINKTDGVPLFVEELTKSVLESLESRGSVESMGSDDQKSLPLIVIPATLHDSLMARLDRLGSAKGVAQLGATLNQTT